MARSPSSRRWSVWPRRCDERYRGRGHWRRCGSKGWAVVMAVRKTGSRTVASSASGPTEQRTAATGRARGAAAASGRVNGARSAAAAGGRAGRARGTAASGERGGGASGATAAASRVSRADGKRGEAEATGPRQVVTSEPERTMPGAEDRPGTDPLSGDVPGHQSALRPSPDGGPRWEGSGFQRGGCEVWPD